MKNNILSVLLLAISTFASAQKSEISFGVKGGYSLSNMKFFGEKMDPKSYFYVVILAEKPISSQFSVQAEVLYTQLGGKESYPGAKLINNNVVAVNDMKTEFKIDQIQIPISAKYYFIPKLSASVGMNFGFNISSHVKADTLFGEISGKSENLKTLALFPFVGAEYKITEKLFIDARYNFNFFEMNKSNSVPIKIGFLQAGIGYRFK